MLRITIEQDDRIGGSPQIQTFAVSNHTQAMDGGGAPPVFTVLRRRAMKEPVPVQASPSIPHLGDVTMRDAGSAPRVLRAYAKGGTTLPPVRGVREMVKPSNGGAAPGGKA